jgi:hypothetical protein
LEVLQKETYKSVGPFLVGRDSSVGIATTLRAGRSGDRIPVGDTFSIPVQTGTGVHPASWVPGVSGVKRPGRGVDHLLPSSAEVKERVELYLCFLSGPSWPVPGRTKNKWDHSSYNPITVLPYERGLC